LNYLYIYVIGALICPVVASQRGYYGIGWVIYSLLLWPLALLHLLVLPKNRAAIERRELDSGEFVRCPHCAEVIKLGAKVCRLCGREVAEELAPARAYREFERRVEEAQEPNISPGP